MGMRTNFYFKIVVDHEKNESIEKLSAELRRAIERLPIVRSAEMDLATPED